MFGDMPAQGMYLRHVKNVTLSDIEIAALSNDARPVFILQNVSGADLFHIKTPAGAPALEIHDSAGVQAGEGIEGRAGAGVSSSAAAQAPRFFSMSVKGLH